MAAPKFVQKGIRQGKAWWLVETPHYLLMFDKVSRKIVEPKKFARQAERRLIQVAALLRLKRNAKTNRYPLAHLIPYFVHDPAVSKWGSVGQGAIDVPAHKAQAFYKHEEAHAILHRAVGCPPPLFNEGFAMYAAQSPRSNRNHRLALAALEDKALPSISRITDFNSFFLREWKKYKATMYLQAGSFVQFLFDRFGYRRFLALCRRLSFTDRTARVQKIFREIYGKSLSDAEKMWKRYLLRNFKG